MMLSLILMLIMTAVTPAVAGTKNNNAEAQRITCIQNRVKEIQDMNFRQLSVTEKRGLKKELKTMHKELRNMHPTYVYISGGGLLLIILILILLL